MALAGIKSHVKKYSNYVLTLGSLRVPCFYVATIKKSRADVDESILEA